MHSQWGIQNLSRWRKYYRRYRSHTATLIFINLIETLILAMWGYSRSSEVKCKLSCSHTFYVIARMWWGRIIRLWIWWNRSCSRIRQFILNPFIYIRTNIQNTGFLKKNHAYLPLYSSTTYRDKLLLRLVLGKSSYSYPNFWSRCKLSWKYRLLMVRDFWADSDGKWATAYLTSWRQRSSSKVRTRPKTDWATTK